MDRQRLLYKKLQKLQTKSFKSYSNNYFFANFQVYFSIFNTWALLPYTIHVLFYKRNNPKKTLQNIKFLKYLNEITNLGVKNGLVVGCNELNFATNVSYEAVDALEESQHLRLHNLYMSMWGLFFCPIGTNVWRQCDQILSLWQAGVINLSGFSLQPCLYIYIFSVCESIMKLTANCLPEAAYNR